MTRSGIFSPPLFMQMERIARLLAASSIMPEALRGYWDPPPDYKNKNPGRFVKFEPETLHANAMLVTNAAYLWGMDPFQLSPHCYIVHGRLDFDGQVYAAVANYHAGLEESLSVEHTGKGDDRTAKITGRLAGGLERIVVVRLGDAKTTDRGGRVNQQWTRDVDQMLFYHGARRWVRRHAPEVLLGMVVSDPQADELVTIEAERPAAIAEAPAAEPPAITDHTTEILESYLERIRSAGSIDDLRSVRVSLRAETELPAEAVRLVELAGKQRLDNLEPSDADDGPAEAPVDQAPPDQHDQRADVADRYLDRLRACVTVGQIDDLVPGIESDLVLEQTDIDSLLEIAREERAKLASSKGAPA